MATGIRTQLYGFGLDPGRAQHAAQLHEESIIVDMLFQGPCGGPAAFTPAMEREVEDYFERKRDLLGAIALARVLPARLAVAGSYPAYREWWEASGVTVGNQWLVTISWAETLYSLASIVRRCDCLPWLEKALTVSDIRRAKAEGKRAVFIGGQDTIPIGEDIDKLDLLYDFGLRVLGLAYNRMNLVAAGCTERTDAGISNYGARVIARMNDLGIIVDTAHTGHRSTLDAATLSRAPIIDSHTCARALSDHARGKTDEELRAIAATGGVIGVFIIPNFLTTDPNPTVEHFFNHLDYIANLVGPEHVGIGLDWPPPLPAWARQKMTEVVFPMLGFRPEDRAGSQALIDGFRDYRDWPNLTAGLLSRGYSDAEIKGILGENFLRVAEKVWK